MSEGLIMAQQHKAIKKLQAENKRLRSALGEYGQHHTNCYKSIPRHPDEECEPCSCGFYEALTLTKVEK